MTPILQTLLPIVRHHGTKQATDFTQGNACISGSPGDELDAFLSNQGFDPATMLTADRDLLYDAYLDGWDGFFRQRLALPSPVAAAASLGGPEAIRPPVGESPSQGPDVVPRKVLMEFLKVMDASYGRWHPNHEDACWKAIQILRQHASAPDLQSVPSDSSTSARDALLVECREVLEKLIPISGCFCKECWNRGCGRSYGSTCSCDCHTFHCPERDAAKDTLEDLTSVQ